MIDKNDFRVVLSGHASLDSYDFYHKDNRESLPDFSVLRNPDTGETLLENNCSLSAREIMIFLPTSTLGKPDEDDYYALKLSDEDFGWLESKI